MENIENLTISTIVRQKLNKSDFDLKIKNVITKNYDIKTFFIFKRFELSIILRKFKSIEN